MIEPGKAPAELVHGAMSGVQQFLEARHAVNHLAQNSNVIVALLHKPLHFGVDHFSNPELFFAEIHDKLVLAAPVKPTGSHIRCYAVGCMNGKKGRNMAKLVRVMQKPSRK